MSQQASTLQRWLGELRRRKVVRVAAVYAVVAWLLIQIAETTFEPMGLPGWTVKLVISLAVLGFPLACALAWAFDLTPKGLERTPQLAQDGSAAAHSEKAAPSTPTEAAPAESVAILPFVDLSPEADQAYFCDGLAEEIINALCCVRGLRVAARTSSFRFKDRSGDVRRIGRQLGVRAVLEGSVRRSGDRARITAQLVNCADGFHLWSQTYDRQLDDIFAIQSDIAQRMVDALRVTLTPRESQLIERGGTRSAQAYDDFLRGQEALRRYDPLADAATKWFRRAIEHDPDFAQAHAGLANALATKGMWRLDMTPAEFDEAFAASRRAIELEPWMPEAFVARACLASMQGRGDTAVSDFEEAIRLNPTSYYTHYLLGRHYMSEGSNERAIDQFRVAARLAPEEYTPLGMLATALHRLGRRDECVAVCRAALPVVDSHIEMHPDDDTAISRAAIMAAWLGDRERVAELCNRALTLKPDSFAALYNGACAYASVGDGDRALELLDRAIAHGRGNLAWIEHDEEFAALRGDPRFERILDRLRKASGTT